MSLILTSAQEAAFNACGEAMKELGGRMSFTSDADWVDPDKAYFIITGKPDGAGKYVSGSGETPAAAALRYIVAANTELANPTRTTAELKNEAVRLANESGNAELAAKIAALPVKEC